MVEYDDGLWRTTLVVTLPSGPGEIAASDILGRALARQGMRRGEVRFFGQWDWFEVVPVEPADGWAFVGLKFEENATPGGVGEMQWVRAGRGDRWEARRVMLGALQALPPAAWGRETGRVRVDGAEEVSGEAWCRQMATRCEERCEGGAMARLRAAVERWCERRQARIRMQRGGAR